MKYLNILYIIFFASIFSCDKDFSSIESDVINSNNAINFSTDFIDYPLTTTSQLTPPFKSNNLPSFLLGYYNDNLFGESSSNFVGQIVPSEYNPSFGENIVLDSVILTVPYFSRVVDTDEDGVSIYEIDSVYNNAPTKISVFKNNFFLRSFNPNTEFDDSQNFYSNSTLSFEETLNESDLEGELLYESSIIGDGSDDFIPSNESITLTELDSLGESFISANIAPALRFKLNNPNGNFWQNMIFDKEDDIVLSNQNNFMEHFRGIYIKAENMNSDGSLMLLNFASSNSKIIIYYTSETSTINDSDTGDTIEIETSQNQYELNFTGNLVNLYNNNFTVDVSNANEDTGDEKIFLKGGEGYMGMIKLFDGEVENENGEMIDAFENFKSSFYDDTSEKALKIINEAYIEFYVDQSNNFNVEPDRIYLYNYEQNSALIDYYLDQSVSSTTINAKIDHLQPLQRLDDSIDGDGIKYKIKITEHLNNLILRDSTNAKLALVVTSNVAAIQNFSFINESSVYEDLSFPSGAILTPKSTILHGNQSIDVEKRPKIRIYYTDPNE